MASKHKSYHKKSKHRNSNKAKKYTKSKSKSTAAPLSLSPFYSFSSHWSYITQQFLCLSSWGTCVGGINEQYDNILDHEAWSVQSIQNGQYKSDIEYTYYDTNTTYNKTNTVLNTQHRLSEYEYRPTKYQSIAKQKYHDTKHNDVQHDVPTKQWCNTDNTDNNIRYPKLSKSKDTPEYSEQKHERQSVAAQDDDYKDNKASTAPKDQLQIEKHEEVALKHKKAQSFTRKLSEYNVAIETKRKSGIESDKWRNKHPQQEREFKRFNEDGTTYIERFSASPAAHGVRPHLPKKISTRDYSKHMKSMEDPSGVVFHDTVATASASDKIKYFQRLQTPVPKDD